MAAQHNLDLLRGACLANGVCIDGNYGELRLALGGVLVDKMLGSSPPPSTFPPPSAAANNGSKKRACDQDTPKEKKPRKPSKKGQYQQRRALMLRQVPRVTKTIVAALSLIYILKCNMSSSTNSSEVNVS